MKIDISETIVFKRLNSYMMSGKISVKLVCVCVCEKESWCKRTQSSLSEN